MSLSKYIRLHVVLPLCSFLTAVRRFRPVVYGSVVKQRCYPWFDLLPSSKVSVHNGIARDCCPCRISRVREMQTHGLPVTGTNTIRAAFLKRTIAMINKWVLDPDE